MGPRLYLFLGETDIHLKDRILDSLAKGLPYTCKGYSVNFSTPDPDGGGIRHTVPITTGEVSPLVWIHTPEDFRKSYLGKQPETLMDWLSLSEHRLLAFTAGRLYLIASQWAVISEEQAFVKRCGVRGDDIGSRIVCARIAERLVRLCFLYENRYAPYSKWFGTAFSALPVNPEIGSEIRLALMADDILQRERHLVAAQTLVALLHNEKGLTEPVGTAPETYYDRDIQVIYTDRIAETVQKQITDEKLRSLPPFGTLSQVGNFVVLSDEPEHQPGICALYENL